MRCAIVLLLAAVTLRPQNGEALLAQGIEQFNKAQYSAALETLKQAVRISPADARIITYLALTQVALGDCTHINELAMQYRRNPDPAIRRLAGLASVRCLAVQNRFSELLPILADLLNKDPNDPDVLYESANLYNRAFNVTVYEMFQRAPSSYRTNQLSAEILERQGRHADAAAEYRRAITKNPKALNLHVRLARAILLASQKPEALEEARKECEAELALNASDPIAEYQLGQILAAENKPPDAASHFEKAIALRPTFAEALIGLAKIHQSANEYDEAIKLLQRAIQAVPSLESAHSTLAAVYRDAGKNKDAQREQKELEKLQKQREAEFPESLRKLQ